MDTSGQRTSIRDYLNRPRLSTEALEGRLGQSKGGQDPDDILTLVDPVALQEYYEQLERDRPQRLAEPLELDGNPEELLRARLDELRARQQQQQQQQQGGDEM